MIASETAKSPHELFIWQSGGTKAAPQWAVRKGEWKLLHAPLQSNPAELDANGLMLVNLQSDPGEKVNLASKYPAKVQELRAAYQEWLIRVDEK